MPETKPAELMVQLIDEMKRGHGRLISLQDDFIGADEPAGLARTVLTAVVLAVQPPTIPRIGRSLGYPRQTILRQAQLLEAAGFVEFIDNPDHKRARCLVATPAAREMHARSSRRSLDWAKKFTADLDPTQLASTVETLRAIRKRLETEARTRKRQEKGSD